MKIVNRTTFLAMPPGTVFAKYTHPYFDDLRIKGETIAQRNEFAYQDISNTVASGGAVNLTALLRHAEVTGESLAMDFHCEHRLDALWDNDQLFAVWEKADVEGLIVRLQAVVRE